MKTWGSHGAPENSGCMFKNSQEAKVSNLMFYITSSQTRRSSITTPRTRLHLCSLLWPLSWYRNPSSPPVIQQSLAFPRTDHSGRSGVGLLTKSASSSRWVKSFPNRNVSIAFSKLPSWSCTNEVTQNSTGMNFHTTPEKRIRCYIYTGWMFYF